MLRSVAGYTTKNPGYNSTNIRKDLNILNRNNEILKSRSQWKRHILRLNTENSCENLNIQPQKEAEI